jgi:hypothetical protein
MMATYHRSSRGECEIEIDSTAQERTFGFSFLCGPAGHPQTTPERRANRTLFSDGIIDVRSGRTAIDGEQTEGQTGLPAQGRIAIL